MIFKKMWQIVADENALQPLYNLDNTVNYRKFPATPLQLW